MVWSDQSQFPFYVIDNNGNTILTIDDTGLHLVGPLGEIDGIISGSGYPTFNFTNAGAVFDHGELGFLPIGGGGGQNAIRLAVWNDATNTIIGQLQIDSQGNGYFYGAQDVSIQSDTNLRLIRTNGPTVTLGGAAVVFSGPGNPPTQVEYNAGQSAFLVDGVGAGWTGVTFQNGWANLGGTFDTCAYGLTPDGRTRLRGLAIGGTKTDGTVIANIPTPFRPVKDKVLSVVLASNGWGTQSPHISIRAATGNVEIWGVSASGNGTHSWDGLEYDRF